MTKPTRRVTLPYAPWETPPEAINDAITVPAPHHVRRLIVDAFTGEVDKADLLYMARAILQMSDEIFELRAKIEGIEAGLTARSTSK